MTESATYPAETPITYRKFKGFKFDIVTVSNGYDICWRTINGVIHREPCGFKNQFNDIIRMSTYNTVSVCFLFITRSVSTTPVRVDSCALTSHVLLYALTPLTAYGARLIQRSCDVISFLMVFMCLLLSIFSTIRQYNEASSYILYYLVSLYTFSNTFFSSFSLSYT